MNSPDPIAEAFRQATEQGDAAGSSAINTKREQAAILADPSVQATVDASAAALPVTEWDTARLEVELGNPASSYHPGGNHQALTAPPPIQTPAAHPLQQAPALPTIPVQGEPLLDVVTDHLGAAGSQLRILAKLGVAGEPTIELRIPLSKVFQRIPPQDIQAMLAGGGTQVQEFKWTLLMPQGSNREPRKAYHLGSQPPAKHRTLVTGGIQRIWQLENAQKQSPTEGVAMYRLIEEIRPKSPQEQAAEASANALAYAMRTPVQGAPPGMSHNPFEVDPGPVYQPPPGHQVHHDAPPSRLGNPEE